MTESTNNQFNLGCTSHHLPSSFKIGSTIFTKHDNPQNDVPTSSADKQKEPDVVIIGRDSNQILNPFQISESLNHKHDKRYEQLAGNITHIPTGGEFKLSNEVTIRPVINKNNTPVFNSSWPKTMSPSTGAIKRQSSALNLNKVPSKPVITHNFNDVIPSTFKFGSNSESGNDIFKFNKELLPEVRENNHFFNFKNYQDTFNKEDVQISNTSNTTLPLNFDHTSGLLYSKQSDVGNSLTTIKTNVNDKNDFDLLSSKMEDLHIIPTAGTSQPSSSKSDLSSMFFEAALSSESEKSSKGIKNEAVTDINFKTNSPLDWKTSKKTDLNNQPFSIHNTVIENDKLVSLFSKAATISSDSVNSLEFPTKVKDLSKTNCNTVLTPAVEVDDKTDIFPINSPRFTKKCGEKNESPLFNFKSTPCSVTETVPNSSVVTLPSAASNTEIFKNFTFTTTKSDVAHKKIDSKDFQNGLYEMKKKETPQQNCTPNTWILPDLPCKDDGFQFLNSVEQQLPTKFNFQGRRNEKCQETQANINDFNWNDVWKILECPICLLIPTDKVVSCEKGHHICFKCQQELYTCPWCQMKYTNARNFAIEQLIECIPLPCKFQSDGCELSFKSQDKLHHESKCVYNPEI